MKSAFIVSLNAKVFYLRFTLLFLTLISISLPTKAQDLALNTATRHRFGFLLIEIPEVIKNLNYKTTCEKNRKDLNDFSAITFQSPISSVLICPDISQQMVNTDNISALVINVSELKDKKVLSLGEGRPNMVPYLIERNIDAYGLDLSNENADQVDEIFKKYPGKFVHSSAADFSKTPLAENGFDLVISSHLLCSVPEELIQPILLESLRVLRAGGSARHIFSKTEINPDTEEFKKLIEEVIMHATNEGIEVQYTSAKGFIGNEPYHEWHQILIFERY